MTATPLVPISLAQAGEYSSVAGLRRISHVWSMTECRRLVEAMHGATHTWATTRRSDGELVVDRRRRSVRHAHFSPALALPVVARFRELLPVVAQLYGESLADIESPQFLTYGPGDGYALHRDTPLEPGPESRRRVSAVLFLNHEFAGGELRLHHTVGARWIFEPIIEAGCLVLFRSTTLHEVAPVHSGLRHTIAGWFLAPRCT